VTAAEAGFAAAEGRLATAGDDFTASSTSWEGKEGFCSTGAGWISSRLGVADGFGASVTLCGGWRLSLGDLPVAGCFPRALALITGGSSGTDSTATFESGRSGFEVKLPCWLPDIRDPADEPPCLEIISELPVDDWELGRRGSTGLRFAAEVATTNFLVGVPPRLFEDLPGGVVEVLVARSRCAAAVLLDELSSSGRDSSSESGGEANRAVGRGPVLESPLDFFKMGCGGGGRLDEAESSLIVGVPTTMLGSGTALGRSSARISSSRSLLLASGSGSGCGCGSLGRGSCSLSAFGFGDSFADNCKHCGGKTFGGGS
jgi:hypothetical protein